MKHFEFWPPRLFELPYYLYLAAGALVRRLPPKFLAKANYALNHGEIGIGSKTTTQFAFDQSRFLPTIALPTRLSDEEKAALLHQFAREHGFPLILKSDIGSVGKGVVKISNADEIETRVGQLSGPYMAQKYSAYKLEFGVFYVRQSGVPKISAINQKHFPTVVGDGSHTLDELARAHERHTAHWQTFMQYQDLSRVPEAGEVVQLSFIGSHTMGCKFTEDTHLLTDELAESVFAIFNDQPGFNFGRLDVKTSSNSAFAAGDFVVIEVNGVASLPTNMFDPENSLLDAYRVFIRHGRYLLDIANEHRDQAMELSSYREIITQVRDNSELLNRTHQNLMSTQ